MTPRVSLVVISYEMKRELPRTLLSLSPQYQNCAAEEYEIIVIDNNSRRTAGCGILRRFQYQSADTGLLEAVAVSRACDQ
jgi:hypothetical protein